MLPITATDPKTVPLCVDLDGTVIKTDLLWESLVVLLRRNPLYMFAVLFWWLRGRAHLKQQIGARVEIDAALLPYDMAFMDTSGIKNASGAPFCWSPRPTAGSPSMLPGTWGSSMRCSPATARRTFVARPKG